MSNNYYELRWTSADGQGEMPSGEFSSKAEALANIANAKAEHLAGCTSDEDRAGIEAGSFDVIYAGPEFIISNVELENYDDGILLAHFDVQQIDKNGDQVAASREADWIDLDDGLLVEYGSDSNMYHWSKAFSSEENEAIHGAVNDYFRENPIPEAKLQAVRDAKEARDAEILAM